MGMFDYIQFGDLQPTVEKLLEEQKSLYSELALPPTLISEEGGQTKSLDNSLSHYTFFRDEMADKVQLFVFNGPMQDELPVLDKNSPSFTFCPDVVAKIEIRDSVFGDFWDVWHTIEVVVVDGVVRLNSIRLTDFSVHDATPRIAMDKAWRESLKESLQKTK
jgi:hypothetical protein